MDAKLAAKVTGGLATLLALYVTARTLLASISVAVPTDTEAMALVCLVVLTVGLGIAAGVLKEADD